MDINGPSRGFKSINVKLVLKKLHVCKSKPFKMAFCKCAWV